MQSQIHLLGWDDKSNSKSLVIEIVDGAVRFPDYDINVDYSALLKAFEFLLHC